MGLEGRAAGFHRFGEQREFLQPSPAWHRRAALRRQRALCGPAELQWLEACKAAGFKHNPDFNGADQEGVGFFQFVIKDGERFGTAKSYLRPALERPNLTLKTGVLVIRILIGQGRAVGVEYLENGRLQTALAASEVVMSAGAIGTAQQLLLSGIGPATNCPPSGEAGP